MPQPSQLQSPSTGLTIDFYFDFSSPYSYFAAEKIAALAGPYNVDVNWKPFLLGAIFKATGGTVLLSAHEWKASYALEDFSRCAQLYGIDYKHPSKFPQGAVTACRAVAWAKQTHGSAAAISLARGIFRLLFVNDGDINDIEQLKSVARSLAMDGDAMEAGLKDPQIKSLVAVATDEAAKDKVFGAPMLILDGERFWGVDRFGLLEDRIKQKLGGKGYQTMVEQALDEVDTFTPLEALAQQSAGAVLVDLRDPRELERDGVIPGAVHAPRGMVEFWVDPKSPYYKPMFDPSKQFIFFCAAGWRSALTTQTMQDMALLPRVAHMDGGYAAWKASGNPTESKPKRA